MSTLNLGSSLVLDSDIIIDGGEVKTGATIGGKPVYKQIRSINVSFTGNTGSTTQSASLFSINNFRSLVSLRATHGGGMAYPLTSPYAIQAYLQVGVVSNIGTCYIYFRNSGSTYTASCVVTIEYTKSTN